MSVGSPPLALLTTGTQLLIPMSANDRQRVGLTPFVKRWWTRTRDLWRIRKRKSETENLKPQGIISGVPLSKDDTVRVGKYNVGPKEGIFWPEGNLVRDEGVIGCNEEESEYGLAHDEESEWGLHDEDIGGSNSGGLIQPEEDTADPVGGILKKEISIFHAGASGEREPRICLLDSCAPFNIISTEALEGIRCDVQSGHFGVIHGLGSYEYPVIGTVKLRFKFWHQDEIFEEEFHVLPRIKFLGYQFGPGFDCLLCWEWMRTNRRAWYAMLEDAD